jgi:predicted  nucleic acid-binding Zn-ribbon protein
LDESLNGYKAKNTQLEQKIVQLKEELKKGNSIIKMIQDKYRVVRGSLKNQAALTAKLEGELKEKHQNIERLQEDIQ